LLFEYLPLSLPTRLRQSEAMEIGWDYNHDLFVFLWNGFALVFEIPVWRLFRLFKPWASFGKPLASSSFRT
jgi:hypothetical protein